MLDEEVREFLIECSEILVTLDQEIVRLEESPGDANLVASVFRGFHTIKGTVGFFGFDTLGAIAHVAENILDQVRQGQRPFTPELAALLLESLDAIQTVVATIEAEGNEGAEDYTTLRNRLTEAHTQVAGTAAVSAVTAVKAAPAPPVERVLPPPQKVVPAVPTAVQPPQNANDTDGDESATAATAFAESTIRVDVGLLDNLMNLVGELVLARNQLLQSAKGQDSEQMRTAQRVNVITRELQEGVLKSRMQPIGVVWNKLPRMIRDLASEFGKQIRLQVEGADTELDKTIIEAIKDPLTHLIRNCCDHGLEGPEQRMNAGKNAQGTVLLRAYHEGGHVNVEISDDGRGLDPQKLKARAVSKGLITAAESDAMSEREAIQLVFRPGFSTAEQITTISGRGVGMDVVKTNIQKIGGMVDIANCVGAPGSRVKIKIPLTLAIIPGLVIKAVGTANSSAQGVLEHRFVIPQVNLLELLRLECDTDRPQIEYVNGSPVYRRRGQLLPLTYLNRVLNMTASALPASAVINIVVLQAEEQSFGLIVDEILDTQEIVVKPLGKRLKGLSSYLGATIMGDGQVALILDVPGLSRLAGILSQARQTRRMDIGNAESERESRPGMLLFRSGSFERIAVPLTLVSRLEQVHQRDTRHAAGRWVLPYRGEILPLLRLSAVLDGQQDATRQPGVSPDETVQLIVLGVGGRQVGVIVDQILDIVDHAITSRHRTDTPGLLGSAMVGGSVTDLLDVHGLLESMAEHLQPAASDNARRVLFAGMPDSWCSMLRGFLEMRNWRVEEAATAEAALSCLQTSSAHAVLVFHEPGNDRAHGVLAAVRGDALLAHTPVVCLAAFDGQGSVPSEHGAAFDSVVDLQHRQQLVDVLDALALPTTAALEGVTQ